jgi:sugar lactone lactonase YvrE
VDASGNLYVADSENSRVLEYTNPFAACVSTFPCLGGQAHMVFGQGGNFSSRGCDSDTGATSSTADDLCDPTGVALDGLGNLFVADSGNERVVKYNTPLTSDTTADTVFGQGGDFTSNICNFDTNAGNPTAHDLCDPTSVALDGSGNLYVSDTVNERVLEYSAPFSSTPAANKVFGQGGSFSTNDCDFDTVDIGFGSSPDDLCEPTGVAVDGAGNLYVGDTNNNRVLEYNSPLGTNTTADAVFGQGGDFTSNVCNFDIQLLGTNLAGSTGNDLCLPAGIAADASGNLFVADEGNSRVLKYNTPLSTDTTADAVLGQDDFTHQSMNLTDAQGLINPEAVAIDASVTPNRLYVTDFNNNRVLGWRDPNSFANGAPADLVVGQPDFLSYFCDGSSGDNVSASDLCFLEGIAVDGLGNLYVADTGNNRVLEFLNPFAACSNTFPCVGGAAGIVVGQGISFTTGVPNEGGLSASSIDSPAGVAVDSAGNVYVADSGNNRLLEYNAPLSTGAAAARVFGQTGSFTSNGCNSDNGGSFSSPPSSIDLCDPSGVALDGAGNLYVSDFNNRRVLEYNTPLNASSGESGAGDATADTVFGQNGSFTTKNCNGGGLSGPTAGNMCVPEGLAVDGFGDLYITDGVNNRVLEYNTPLTTDTIADRVFGTCGSFKKTACVDVSASSLKDPTGVAVDNVGRLYVADNQDNRVLEYAQPLAVATPSATTTPTPSATPTPTATPTLTATATTTLTATPTPTPSGPGHISVNRKTLSLKAAPGATASGSITISNIGTGVLIANITSPKHGPILTETGGGDGITIGPGGMHIVTIVFAPAAKGSTKDLIAITSNDPKHKKIKAKIKGVSK